MTDYLLTKDPNYKTGQLPDKLTLAIPRDYAWTLAQQLLLELKRGESVCVVVIYGKVKTE